MKLWKKWLLGIALLITCSCTTEKRVSDDIIIEFEVKNQAYSQLMVLYHTDVINVPLDENGMGSCSVQGIKNLYATVVYGRNRTDIFIKKGEKIKIAFDAIDIKNTITYNGEKSPVMDYLNTTVFIGLEQDDYKLPFAAFKERLQQKEAEALQLLKARKLDLLAPDFVAIEKARIHYSYMQTLLMYPIGYSTLNNTPDYKPEEEYYHTLASLMVEDVAFLDLKEYLEFMKEASIILSPKIDNTARTHYNKVVSGMKYIAEQCQNDTIRQILLNVFAIETLELNGIKNIAEMENIYNAYVSDSILKSKYQERYSQKDVSANGKPSPDFSAEDQNGKNYTLKDFTGNYLYIDVWATWCAPCRREAPHFTALKEKFTGKKIRFLSLSVDANKEDWLKEVSKEAMNDHSLYLGSNSSFQSAYNIDGIPRFILIDREGKIINNNTPPPSAKETEGYLMTLKEL